MIAEIIFWLGRGTYRFNKKDLCATMSALRKVSLLIEKGLRWVIHNGLSSSFWGDNWSKARTYKESGYKSFEIGGKFLGFQSSPSIVG